MINWSAIDPHSTAGRIIRAPARLIPRSSVVRIRTGRAKGMKWIVGSSLHGCWLGTYELDKQRIIDRLIKPGMTAYDVGSQSGFYTLLLSRLVGTTGQVVSFEPCPYEARYLLDHLRINAIKNVRVIQAAVGAARGLRAFTVDRGITQNCLTETNTSPLTVTVLDLDSLDEAPPDLIKMDIEGGESEALKGASRILSERRPIILVALHGPEHRRACPEILRAAGYRVFTFEHTAIPGDSPVSEILGLPSDST
jgi:FkbM family methyltransferase